MIKDTQYRTFLKELGKTKIASIPHIHKPGELMELDWSWMNELSITIGGLITAERS